MSFDRTSLRPIVFGAERRSLLELDDDRGCLLMYNPADGVLVTRAGGWMSTTMADRWLAATEPLWKQRAKVVVFNDWEKMEGYDSVARKRLTDWVIEHRSQVESGWFLTGSRIVAMGVAAAGAATALVGVPMHASRDRASWERQLRARL